MQKRKSSRTTKPHLVFVSERLEPRKLMSANAVVTQQNLVSDGFIAAANTDANLKNPWGISYAPGKALWISDNGTGLSTLYDGAGNAVSLVVTIPGAGGGSSNPTGQVFNSGTGFQIHKDSGAPAPASFIFVGEDGGISGWNSSVDPTNAILTVDNSGSGAVYKGATLETVSGRQRLLVTNFRSGKVEIYDDSFTAVTQSNAFADKQIPKGFAPFNIRNLNGLIYVTYAKQDAAKHDDVGGAGAGYVDVFNANGKLRERFEHGKLMNSPWGLAVAPSTWGKFAGDILVGQFKSGKIGIYNPHNGSLAGTLVDSANKSIQIDGLWDITPGTGSTTSSDQTLYFTAGSNSEADGLLGSLSFSGKKNSGGTGLGY
jgi:uncharacterized protein (TIGR03118 family)